MNNLMLNERSLIYHLRQYRSKRRLHYFAETESTNEVAKKLCGDGKGLGAFVVSDCQTAGKGRSGRTFCSPKGTGVYISIVYEISGKEPNFDLLSSLAGLAVRDTLFNFFDFDCKIKWPNDILLDGKKICGILCEIVNKNGKPKYAVVGIGLNIEKQEFPEEIMYTAASIGDKYEGELDHNEIAVDIVNNLDRYIIRRDALNAENTGEIINRLKMYSASLGQIVRVITPDSEYDAKVLDIAPDGGLVILSDGETKTITSGEIVHIR